MVKKYIEFITENEDHSVVNMLKQFAKLSSGYQRDYFNHKLECLKRVEISSVRDLFDPKTVERLDAIGKFKKKECYANALHAAQILNNMDNVTFLGENVGSVEVEYVEGYMCYGVIPIEHAFNKVGDYYFDVTREFLFDTTNEEYFKVGEWTFDEALDIMEESGYYGGVFDTVFRNSYKEKLK